MDRKIDRQTDRKINRQEDRLDRQIRLDQIKIKFKMKIKIKTKINIRLGQQREIDRELIRLDRFDR